MKTDYENINNDHEALNIKSDYEILNMTLGENDVNLDNEDDNILIGRAPRSISAVSSLLLLIYPLPFFYTNKICIILYK